MATAMVLERVALESGSVSSVAAIRPVGELLPHWLALARGCQELLAVVESAPFAPDREFHISF